MATRLNSTGVGTLEITQVRSLIGAKANQRATVRSLGLRRLHDTVVQPDRPEIRGMVAKVAHLVTVSYVGTDEVVDLQPGQEPKGAGVPAAGHAVPDDEVAALREAEAEALAVPGSAAAGSVVVLPPGLTSTDAPDAPEPLSDASDDVPNLGVESATVLPRAATDPPPALPGDGAASQTPPVGGLSDDQTGPASTAPAVVDAEQAETVPAEALADPRGDLDDAVAAGDLSPQEAERFTGQDQT